MTVRLHCIVLYNFCSGQIRSERRSCCDVTDQQASHGSREAADSHYARLRHQFRTSASRFEHALDKLLDYVSFVHQQRRQLLHLSGGEQGIQERDEDHDKRYNKESATWEGTDSICARLEQI